MATCSSILAWKIPWGHKESDTIEQLNAHNYLIPPCGWTAGYQIQCLPHRDGNSQISLPDLSFLRLLPFQLTVLSWSVQRPRHHPWINSFSLFSMSYPLPSPTSKDIPGLVPLTMPTGGVFGQVSTLSSMSAASLLPLYSPGTTAVESFTNKNWTMSFPCPKPLSPLPFAHKENPYPLSHVLRVLHSLSFLAPLFILTLLFIQCISTPLAFSTHQRGQGHALAASSLGHSLLDWLMTGYSPPFRSQLKHLLQESPWWPFVRHQPSPPSRLSSFFCFISFVAGYHYLKLSYVFVSQAEIRILAEVMKTNIYSLPFNPTDLSFCHRRR